MTEKQTKWYTFICIVIAALLAVALSCCSSTKQTTATSTYSIEEQLREDIKVKDSLLHVIQSENAELETELRQLRYAGITFQDRCDTGTLRQILTAGLVDKDIITQYLKELADCSNEVTIAADGSIKAKGKIKEAILKEETLKKIISRLQKKYDSLVQVKQKEIIREVEKKESGETKVSVKKKSRFAWWLLAVGLVAGAYLRHRFAVIGKLFSFINL